MELFHIMMGEEDFDLSPPSSSPSNSTQELAFSLAPPKPAKGNTEALPQVCQM